MVAREPPWGKSCPLPQNTGHLVSADEFETDCEAPKPRGPDWAGRNPEAADHEAARNRMRVVENAVAKGGRL